MPATAKMIEAILIVTFPIIAIQQAVWLEGGIEGVVRLLAGPTVASIALVRKDIVVIVV